MMMEKWLKRKSPSFPFFLPSSPLFLSRLDYLCACVRLISLSRIELYMHESFTTRDLRLLYSNGLNLNLRLLFKLKETCVISFKLVVASMFLPNKKKQIKKCLDSEKINVAFVTFMVCPCTS